MELAPDGQKNARVNSGRLGFPFDCRAEHDAAPVNKTLSARAWKPCADTPPCLDRYASQSGELL